MSNLRKEIFEGDARYGGKEFAREVQALQNRDSCEYRSA